MARKRKGRAINGVLLINKHTGESSNRVLQQVKHAFGAAKAGHTGALDPLATGMLPICLGEATKFSQFLLDSDKTYEVTAKLGIRTDTSDSDGEVVSNKAIESSIEEIKAACLSFRGKQKQVPSMFSALKHEGKPLYTYARQGIVIEREPRDIEVYSLEIQSIEHDEIKLKIHCSKGTYIRTIVDDLGEQLGCGAHVSKLHRTSVANYPEENMLSVEALLSKIEQIKTKQVKNNEVRSSNEIEVDTNSQSASSNRGNTENRVDMSSIYEAIDILLLPMDTALQSLPSVLANSKQIHDFTHGQSFPFSLQASKGELVRVYHLSDKRFYGIGELDADDHVQPKRVVVYNEDENTL